MELPSEGEKNMSAIGAIPAGTLMASASATSSTTTSPRATAASAINSKPFDAVRSNLGDLLCFKRALLDDMASFMAQNDRARYRRAIRHLESAFIRWMFRANIDGKLDDVVPKAACSIVCVDDMDYFWQKELKGSSASKNTSSPTAAQSKVAAALGTVPEGTVVASGDVAASVARSINTIACASANVDSSLSPSPRSKHHADAEARPSLNYSFANYHRWLQALRNAVDRTRRLHSAGRLLPSARERCVSIVPRKGLYSVGSDYALSATQFRRLQELHRATCARQTKSVTPATWTWGSIETMGAPKATASGSALPLATAGASWQTLAAASASGGYMGWCATGSSLSLAPAAVVRGAGERSPAFSTTNPRVEAEVGGSATPSLSPHRDNGHNFGAIATQHTAGFAADVLALLDRYHLFGGLNSHLSTPYSLFPRAIAAASVELFGTPLNTGSGRRFCSPFAIERTVWGSLGSFFEYELEPLPDNGIYLCNPPFDDEIMRRMSERLLEQLKRHSAPPSSVTVPTSGSGQIDGATVTPVTGSSVTDAATATDIAQHSQSQQAQALGQQRMFDITIVVTLPVWDTASQQRLGQSDYGLQFAAYELLVASGFLRKQFALLRTDCKYFDFFSDQLVPVANTHLLLLSNRTDLPDDYLDSVRDSWLRISRESGPLK
jgi:hypothetical protein